MLTTVAQLAKKPKIGSSIINIFSRSPALIAMGAATVDTVSNGRLVLGLGASSEPIIQEWHGFHFERPVQRMREYVEIIRLALSGQKVNYNGKLFQLKNFTLLIKPPRKEIPMYLAAVDRKSTRLNSSHIQKSRMPSSA